MGNTSKAVHKPQAKNIFCTEDGIGIELVDGRTITVPLVWFPRLAKATQKQLSNWQMLGDGQGIHWPDVDEDLSVQSLLQGVR